MKKVALLMTVLALAAVGLAACGSSDDSSSSTTAASSDESTSDSASSSSSGGPTVDITADPTGQLKWTSNNLTAKAGNSTIELVNDSPTTHDAVVEDSSGAKVGEAEEVANGKSSFNADLKPGKYTFYCDIPGHREAGMEGTLTVK